MSLHIIPLFLATTLMLCFSACKENSDADCSKESAVLYEQYPYPIGVAVDPYNLAGSPAYEQIVKTQFNSITAENIFKPQYLHPSPDSFHWYEADALVTFAIDNKSRIQGHTLIWHRQLPIWMEKFSGTRAEWEAMLKNHVYTIVDHFKGKVASWDVVNEAFNEDGTLRNTIWHQNLGSSYIEKAFQYAHEADPNTLLFYNDYNLALKPQKRKAVINFLKKLKLKGVPIDGIGMQMHISIAFPENSEIQKAMNEVVQEGFRLHISELDIRVNPYNQEITKASMEALTRQAQKYQFIFNTYNRLPSHLQHGITLWGVSDYDSWIPAEYQTEDFPLLFDTKYEPKPAFCSLINP